MSVTPSQFDLLSKALDGAALKHRVLSNNLANVNTPGYKRLDVDFADQLAAHTDGDGTKEPPAVFVDPTRVARIDGNTVDIDHELGQLNKNSMLAQTFIRLLISKIEMMRTAITGQ